MTETCRRPFTTCAGAVLAFTPLGFGGAPLGNMHRELDEHDAESVLDAAWSDGVRYFDTAPLYGHGLSELRIGRFLAKRPRHEFLVSTKVGRVLEPCTPGEEESGIYKNTPHLRAKFDYSYDGVMRSYEASLGRLKLDSVDILYVHDVDARTHGGRQASESRIQELMIKGGWRALADLRANGDVVGIGIGVNEWQPCVRILELADPDLLLLAGRYTLLEQEPHETLFPHCIARRVGIVVGGAFNSGILARGVRDGATYDYAPAPKAILDRVRRIEAVCRRHDVPMAAAALQFCAAHPAVVSIIAGAQTQFEASQNAVLFDHPIPGAFWDDMKAQGLLAPRAPVPEEKVRC